MAIKKGYGIRVVRSKEDEDEKVLRDSNLYEEEIESVGGIGNYVESIDSILKEDERLEVIPFWYE